ncbi:MAG TPA: HNH endonuclease [Flammeovirgaceae bacterium]|nr:HNH endonuclease [Flammeovirgaceae bacterium]
MKALVLNQDFRPISVCSIQRAFVLVFNKKVEMVASFNGHKFHTVDNEYSIPAVIRLQCYIKVPYRSVELSRKNIFERDNHTCQYCGSKQDLSIDHVIPKSRGGGSGWKNLVTACKACNARKGDFTPEEAGMPLRQQPFKPSFLMFLRDYIGFKYEEWKPFLTVG